MDRDHLTHLIQDPDRVRHEDIADLKSMAERYPWFSGAHLLLAVGGHREGDVLFDEQLRTSAAHLPSRSVLFDHLQAPARSNKALGVSHAEATPVEATLEIVRSTSGPMPTSITGSEVEQEPVPASTPDPAPPVVPTMDEAPVEGKAEPAPPEDPLDKQIRGAAIATTYELLLEQEAVTAAAKAVQQARATFPRAEEARTPSASTSPRSFTSWLSLGSQPSTSEPPADEIHHTVPAEGSIPNEPTDTQALIERFIQQNAQQAPAERAEFFNPQQAAKRSLEEHADLVTETLARIYEKQGNHAKAIAAYERLAVKHPERSAYFRMLAKKLSSR